jgi:hypothetical protein
MSEIMKYNFTINTTASDLWQLSMYGIYGSIIGVTNVVFTAAMILLAARFFSSVNKVLKCLIIIAICIFTVIQPLLVYLRAGKQVKKMPKEINLGFDDEGLHVSLGDQSSDIAWDDVRGITKKPTMLVIFSSERYGYILNNKVLGKQKKDFYSYISTKINQKQ